jgi:hypothetical protein
VLTALLKFIEESLSKKYTKDIQSKEKKNTWNRNSSSRFILKRMPYQPDNKTNVLTQIIDRLSVPNLKRDETGSSNASACVGYGNALKLA